MDTTMNTHDAILAANKTFMETYSQGDAAGIAALYTEGGQFILPNSDFITGREAVQATFQSFIDQGIKTIELETIEIEDYGDTASEVGKYTLKDEGGQVLDHGKLLVIWKQESGQWKLHRDIINSSMPAAE